MGTPANPDAMREVLNDPQKCELLWRDVPTTSGEMAVYYLKVGDRIIMLGTDAIFARVFFEAIAKREPCRVCGAT